MLIAQLPSDCDIPRKNIKVIYDDFISFLRYRFRITAAVSGFAALIARMSNMAQLTFNQGYDGLWCLHSNITMQSIVNSCHWVKRDWVPFRLVVGIQNRYIVTYLAVEFGSFGRLSKRHIAFSTVPHPIRTVIIHPCVFYNSRPCFPVRTLPVHLLISF